MENTFIPLIEPFVTCFAQITTLGVFDWALLATRILQGSTLSIGKVKKKVVNAENREAQNIQFFTILSMNHFFYRKRCFTLRIVKHELPSRICLVSAHAWSK